MTPIPDLDKEGKVFFSLLLSESFNSSWQERHEGEAHSVVGGRNVWLVDQRAGRILEPPEALS